MSSLNKCCWKMKTWNESRNCELFLRLTFSRGDFANLESKQNGELTPVVCRGVPPNHRASFLVFRTMCTEILTELRNSVRLRRCFAFRCDEMPLESLLDFVRTVRLPFLCIDRRYEWHGMKFCQNMPKSTKTWSSLSVTAS